MDQTTQMLDIQQVVQLGRPDFINEENHHG
jgi:hypothetical protein